MKQIDKLFDSIKDISKEKTKAYDTQATVTRVDGGTVYVHIPGGVDETPIDKTISAKPGDVVQVRVANGKAWATGNATAPPTDDSAALRAEAEAAKANQAASSATQSAKVASESAADAQQKATTASTAAANALTKAQEAEDSAEQAATAAATADSKATAAGTAAAAAQTSADQAASAAATADSKATAASSAASRAQTSADQAASAAATADSKATAASSAASRAESSASAASTAASQAVTDAAAAQTAANNAGQAASRAQAAADAAQGEIDDQQEYFWHDALGAHVLSDTDEVTGNRYRTDLKGAGQEIFELDGQTETSVASFGANGARLGETSGAHSVIDEDGQRFYASDGTTQLANIGYGEGQGTSSLGVAPYYTLGRRKNTIMEYSSSSTYNVGDVCIYNNRLYVCTTAIQSPENWRYDHWQYAIGQYSYAEGEDTVSASLSSHAEGNDTLAGSQYSHAEGRETRAFSAYSHVEGFGSIAKKGSSAHAQGSHTIASQYAQTAMGSYNKEDTGTLMRDQKLLIIGNGTDEQNRSDAFTVDWDGNVVASGAITDGSGNKIPEIASGKTASITAAANNYKDLTVSFGRTFSSVPQVVCSIYSTSKAGAIGSLSCSALDVTTTGFKVRVFNAGSASRSPAVDWIAING